ncbi:MAG: YitT family protein [Erysipelotrichia bacterium]|nr:YitT family protein [Erysipelotrichia bacterium]NCC53923.1 YitT family protein [Erysipelotrichia bacterium]
MTIQNKWIKFLKDCFIDIVGGLLIGIGVYNFAVNASFPLAGVSGIALVFYRFFDLPIGWGSILLNIPIIILCYRVLGKKFLFVSLRTLLISSLMIDYVAPLFPVYEGERMLAAVCTGVFLGLGYALIYMNDTSTGGMDFVIMAVKKLKPHFSLGRIILIVDAIVVIMGGFLLQEVDGTIYGMIVTYLMTMVIDKIMFGIDAGKVAWIISDKGNEIAETIDQSTGRGCTIMEAKGGYSKARKQVIMVACSNHEMYRIHKHVKQADPDAFTMIMESDEVLGEGFKEE